MLTAEQRWHAVEQRDAGQDGDFFYGVVTTGVYCKPSCGSRRPLRKNVRFYDTAEQAVKDGLRPCKRCQPEGESPFDAAEQAVRKACQYLKAHRTERLSLAELAARSGMSAAHFHRSFKRMVGVTPKEYADKLRMDDLKQGLKKGGDVTSNVYASGFGSNSRFMSAATRNWG